jgi:peroxiredoxin
LTPRGIARKDLKMELPMRDDLQVEAQFPDFKLPDHTDTERTLSELLGKYLGVLVFDRGSV